MVLIADGDMPCEDHSASLFLILSVTAMSGTSGLTSGKGN